MKMAYFDCFAGISGDMILGALLSAGLELEHLKIDLAKLPIDGYQMEAKEVRKLGIQGIKIDIATNEKHYYHLNHTQQIIRDSKLPDEVKGRSIDIFTHIAQAEAKVYQTKCVHPSFHQAGTVNSIISVIGSVCGLWRLGVEKIHASALHIGNGFIESNHGLVPTPTPATMELLYGVPIYSNNIDKELVTITGASILTTYCHDFGPMPPMRVEKIGYGVGNHDLNIPNLLRLYIGQSVKEKAYELNRFEGNGSVHQEQALMMEVNIDDMNPEFYDYILTQLLQAGAMDAFYQNIQMKKNRPACTLSVLIYPHQVEQFCNLIFTETTSIGLRVYPVTKYMQPYEIIMVATHVGSIKVKISRNAGKVFNVAPEFEDCRELASKHRIPLKEIYDLAKYTAYKLLF